MIIPGEKAALGGLEGSSKWNREMAERYKGKGQGQTQIQKEGQEQIPAQDQKQVESHLQRGQSQDQVPLVDAEKEMHGE